MATLHCKQDFPETTDNKRDGIQWKEMDRPVEEIVPQAIWVETAEARDNRPAPALKRITTRSNHFICLVTDVVHAIEHGWESAEPHRDHDAL